MKVKAHAESDVLAGRLDVESYIQNLLADAGAGCIAESLVCSQAGKTLEQTESRAFMIAMRLAVIEAQCQENEPQLVLVDEQNHPATVSSTQEQATQMRNEILNNGHALVVRGKFLFCRGCKKRRKVGDLTFWRNAECDLQALRKRKLTEAGSNGVNAREVNKV